MSSGEGFPKNAILKKRGDTSTYNWKGIIVAYVIPRIAEYLTEGIIPTIRGMFYYLTDAHVVEKNYKVYKKFDKALVTARKRRPSEWGYIAIGTFSDNTRRIIDINDKYYTLEEQIDFLMFRITHLPEDFKDTIPKWLGQPNYVEVWIEKDALTGTIHSILKDSKVRIAPNRGWGGMEFLYKNIERLEAQIQKNNNGEFEGIKDIWILYVGDFDPSGLKMDGRYERELNKLNLRLYQSAKESGGRIPTVKIHFKRIALTWEQITEFKLEDYKNAILTPKEIEKLKNDPNAVWFKRQYGSLFQIQSDTLQLQLPKFKKLLIDEVNSLFNEDIREQVLSTPEHSLSPREIWQQIKDTWTFHSNRYDEVVDEGTT